MENATFTIAVVALAVGGLLGVAYSLDVRRERHGPIGPELPPPGAVGHGLWWAGRILLAMMLVSVAAAYFLRLPDLAWLAVGCAALFLLDHLIFQVIRLTGK